MRKFNPVLMAAIATTTLLGSLFSVDAETPSPSLTAAQSPEHSIAQNTQSQSLPNEALGISREMLSTSFVEPTTGNVQLVFTGRLDAESAKDPTRYTVQIDGELISAEASDYDPSTNTVTLRLPKGALRAGSNLAWPTSLRICTDCC